MPIDVSRLRMKSMFPSNRNMFETEDGTPISYISNGRNTFEYPGADFTHVDLGNSSSLDQQMRKSSMDLYNSYKNRLNPDVTGPSNDVLDFNRYMVNSRADRKIDADIALAKDKQKDDEHRLSNEDKRIAISDRNSNDQITSRDRRLDTVEQALKDKETIQQGKDQTALDQKLQARNDVKSKAQEGLDLLDKMMLNGSFSAPLQRATGKSANIPYLDKFPGSIGTDTAKGNADISQLKNILTIDLLNNLRNHSKNGSTGFGRMTDKDLKVIQDAASQLDYKNMSEGDYANQLGLIRKNLQNIVGQQFDPEMGEVKTFPNGKKGKWDGKGWELVQ